MTERRTRQARRWRYWRLSGTAGSARLRVLISPGLQFMAIMAVYFQPLWWILLNYWPLWGRDGFASVLQIAGHHCDIQVKSTWHTEQVLTDYESECKASRLIIICRISGWGVLMGSKSHVTKETNSKSITCSVIDPQAITKIMCNMNAEMFLQPRSAPEFILCSLSSARLTDNEHFQQAIRRASQDL